MASAMHDSIAMLGVPVEDALRMASPNPAKFVKLDDRLGRRLPGYRADLVLLDRDLSFTGTGIRGVSSSNT